MKKHLNKIYDTKKVYLKLVIIYAYFITLKLNTKNNLMKFIDEKRVNEPVKLTPKSNQTDFPTL